MFGSSDREAKFEAVKKRAKEDFEKDPKNVEALIRWGGSLLELSHFKQGKESEVALNEAVSRFQLALELDPNHNEARWMLGNTYTSLGFVSSDREEALQKFKLSEDCFVKCLEADPDNASYHKSLSMVKKAPEYYDEVQKYLSNSAAQQEEEQKVKAASGSDFWWDVAGFVLLGAGIITTLALIKRSSDSSN
mmetsp:Transcript_7378/g.14531  ORF Transcript_7378/g.14531 Transcript_7378/m.14531 type:complete len:192 (-) Transcript_7378:391-966(-)